MIERDVFSDTREDSELIAAKFVATEEQTLHDDKSSIKYQIKSFYEERQKKKDKLYILILYINIALAILVVLLGFATLFTVLNNIGVFMIISAILRTSTFCLFSLIPTDEFDIFTFILEPRNKITFLFITMIIGFGGNLGIAFIIWLKFNQTNLTGKIVLLTTFLPASIVCTSFLRNFYKIDLCKYKNEFIVNSLLIFLVWPLARIGWVYIVFADDSSFLVLQFIVCGLYLLISVAIFLRDYKLGKFTIYCKKTNRISNELENIVDLEDHWGANSFSNYIFLFAVFSNIEFQILNGINSIINNSWTTAIYNFVGGIIDLIPICSVLILGSHRFFSLIGRFYEYDVKRQKDDGAFLATLISSFSIEDKRLWIHRKTICKKGTFDGIKPAGISVNIINRNNWILGEIVHTDLIIFMYRENIRKDWVAYFNDTNLIIRKEDDCEQIDHKTVYNKDESDYTFKSWVEENFDIKQIKDSVDDLGEESVYVEREKTTASQLIEFDDQMKEFDKYANEHMREYHYEKNKKEEFENIFKASPRDMKDNEKETLLLKSAPVRVSLSIFSLYRSLQQVKIDYFISHSWSDDVSEKNKKLVGFAEKFYNKRFRYPTFWIDRVCIDQKDILKGVAVLPINIGACGSMLVVMSKTYLTRLWCIWELFTIFTFCNKELALDRIEIVYLDDRDECIQCINEFSLNNAHCYDPNEEYKLRQLFAIIGGDNNENKSKKSKSVEETVKLLLRLTNK